ncbi:hypothetical protein BJ508DRAFT_410007 [Ascobolus immersus RN42]|uniref:mRNA 3'-end-processing protein n=1 Tax=Ascobolus immersus RN42 TaxID=1160509 RepID=A0A3N4IQA5_ASCIM|nr:hypothetical protein BJ508DRAFT_410007 [Ascobolus immersus RN42]
MATAAAAAAQILGPSGSTPKFAFAEFLQREYKFGLDPNRPVCEYYARGHCPKGDQCPNKHIQQSSYNNLVCKHWLRGLCKKSANCEFLHEYNLRKMPECNFFLRNNYCSNGEECLYLHIDPESRLPPCPHYEQGFCPLGPNCSKKHVRKEICPYYLCGFCWEGRGCKNGAHPKWIKDLPPPTVRKPREERKDDDWEMRDRDRDDDMDRRRDDMGGRHGGQDGMGGRDGRHGGQDGRDQRGNMGGRDRQQRFNQRRRWGGQGGGAGGGGGHRGNR